MKCDTKQTMNLEWLYKGGTVRVELMARWLSGLQHLKRVQCLRVHNLLRPTFYSYLIESVSSEYLIYHLTMPHSYDYLEKTPTK